MKRVVGNGVGTGGWFTVGLDDGIQGGVVPIAKGHVGVRESRAYGIWDGAQGSLRVAILGRRVGGS